jgi:hypothetical protein
MKIIISDSRITNLAIHWLRDKYPNLVSENRYGTTISYINTSNDTIVFEYHYDRVVSFWGSDYSIMKKLFGLSPKEVSEVFKQWITNDYGLDVSLVLIMRTDK